MNPAGNDPGRDDGSLGPSAERGPSLSELIALQWQRERPELDLDNFLLAIYLMRAGALIERAFDRDCQKNYGVNGGDMRVMLALRRSGPPYVKRPTDLFRALLVTSGAVTKKVDRLAQDGFVERLPDPSHSGGFLVHLTKKGLHVVEAAVHHLATKSVLGPAMSRLSAEQRKLGFDFALHVVSELEQLDVALPDSEEPKPGKRKKRS